MASTHPPLSGAFLFMKKYTLIGVYPDVANRKQFGVIAESDEKDDLHLLLERLVPYGMTMAVIETKTGKTKVRSYDYLPPDRYEG